MNTSPHWHFVGIGGIGMSGLAQMCRHAGYRVSGSDRGADKPENRRIFEALRRQSIAIHPQDGSFIRDGRPDAIIYSSAIEEDNPDFRAAAGIPRLHRSQALAAAIAAAGASPTIAVTGSCGKTSVTGYLGEALARLGADYAVLNGGLVKAFIRDDRAGNFRPGAGGLVFEADESDKSLLEYTPDYAVVLNIGTDHYDKEELARMFGAFVARAHRGAILSSDVAGALQGRLPEGLPLRIFAPSGVDNYEVADGVASAELEGYPARLPQPGFHTALNCLAVKAVLEQLGFTDDAIMPALENLNGSWRRFDFAGYGPSGARIYDDYAHNPEKVAGVIRAAGELAGDAGRVFAIFQPHGYGPLGFMRDELYEQLRRVLGPEDRFIMLEPYYAGGTSSFKPTSAEVTADWQARGGIGHLHHAGDRAEARALVASCSPCSRDIVLILGGRDNSLSDWAKQLACGKRPE